MKLFHTLLSPIRWVLSQLFLLFYSVFIFVTVTFILFPLTIVSRRIALKVGFYLWRILLFVKYLVLGTKFSIKGLENLPSGSFIIALRHESHWETMEISFHLKRPIWILKKELTNIPGIGSYLRSMGSIPIDRSEGIKSIKQMNQQVGEFVKQGDSQIILFPQGTRVAPDDFETDIKRGIISLYEHTNLPILPVAITTSGAWPVFLKNCARGNLIMQIFPSIPPGMERKKLMSTLEEILNKESKKLRIANVYLV